MSRKGRPISAWLQDLRVRLYLFPPRPYPDFQKAADQSRLPLCAPEHSRSPFPNKKRLIPNRKADRRLPVPADLQPAAPLVAEMKILLCLKSRLSFGR